MDSSDMEPAISVLGFWGMEGMEEGLFSVL